jgi:tyrosine-protein phosphatase YwqE
MFFFKKRHRTEIDLSWLKADMHSHLVPAIDDGSPDLATSVEMIRGLAGLGYKKIITTPHILWEMYPNTPDRITSGMEEVRKAVHAAGMEVELHAAAEYFMDDHFNRQLQLKAPLLPLSGNLILVEFSMITAPMEVQQIIFEMEIQNYQPVIAHPERYVYLIRKKDFYDELRDAGCWFQLNLLSLTGYYGAAVQQLAEYLLKKEYYDLAGTDMHSLRHLEVLKKLSPIQVKRLQDTGLFKNDQL